MIQQQDAGGKNSTLTSSVTELTSKRAFVGTSTCAQERSAACCTSWTVSTTRSVTHAVVERRLAGDRRGFAGQDRRRNGQVDLRRVRESSTGRLASFQLAKAEAGDGDRAEQSFPTSLSWKFM
jgi:hypothetical protein